MGDNRFGCTARHDRVGVLLAQLGTPDAPEPRSLRRYLKQFLWDPRVIEKNRAVWWAVLNGIVLRTRPKRSAALYKRIWTEQGSPLLLHTERQTMLLSRDLGAADPTIRVVFGMRYGSPSIERAIDTLIEDGCSRILLVPMYPQYSATTTASTYDAVFKHLLARRDVPTLRVAAPYYRHPAYVSAQATIINEAYKSFKVRPEKLVLSYHGIPEAYIERGDPYCCHCSETTAALLPLLTLAADDVIHTYQSRFGKDPWLVPYTDETIEGLARSGVKRIAVACPGFTADCLETLDELGNEGRHAFAELGGEDFQLIPCLNDHPAWIRALSTIVREELGGWLGGQSAGSRVESCGCPVACAKRGDAWRCVPSKAA